jgi:hypothetical protein
MTSDINALADVLGQAVSTASAIGRALNQLDQLIDDRAATAAQPLIAAAEQAAAARITEVEAQLQRRDDLIARMTCQVAAMDRQITRLRTEQATPRAYPSRPLTADQERSVRNNECRTPDDPALPADPYDVIADLRASLDTRERDDACRIASYDVIADLRASLDTRERDDACRIAYHRSGEPYLECGDCGDLAASIDPGDTLGVIHARAAEHRERDHQPDPDPDYGKDLDEDAETSTNSG